ncbi:MULTISPECIES: hypothetical protein [Prochlorococcus]|uniref:hypothetical protein n=1 Tax=Prochlorococcus TaxID=1218 RepID=UPI0007B3E8E8|nr:hypothetical protein [Prochlorococcus marinus]KZR80929.1 hypothetical protein PMIT1327_01377 [Prochlorococcus marinus str. MIT 1327]
MARNQVNSIKGRQLKVQQLIIPEIEKLQHKELKAQQPLTINKPIKQIPKQPVKKTHKKGANRLEAPYTTPNPAKPGKTSPSELKKQKQEMLDWLNKVRIG